MRRAWLMMNPDELCSLTTRFQVGSVSKQFVAAAVLLAREGDLLRLDEPISRWFDDLRPDLGSITVHQLLSHTSGLGHWDDVPEFNVLEPPPPDEMFIGISAMRPASSPGSHWSYSGPGYLLAAWSVERLTGVPYSTFVSNRILGPLGMEATTSGTFRTDAGAARGYYAGARARGVTGLAQFPGTGDMWSTVGDLTRYSEHLASGALLSPASLEALSTEHTTTGMPFATSEWLTQDAYGYGYGYFLGRLGSRPIRFHTGDNPGYRSLIGWLPGSETSFALLSNDEACDLVTELRRSAAVIETQR
jgi:CubicO group peptidase (beta-lactamase class C family)